MENQISNLPTKSSSNKSFPSFEDMQDNSKKPPNFLIAVIVILLTGVGVIWYFFNSDIEYAPAQVHKASVSPSLEPQDQLNEVDIGNVDVEFQSVDKDVNSL